MSGNGERLYSVVHRNGQPWNHKDFEKFALKHRDLHLVYCDMDGFYVDEYGDLYIADECGNFAYIGEDEDRKIVWHRDWEGFYEAS